MYDQVLEKRLLQYIILEPNEVFSRTDEDFFFIGEYRVVYRKLFSYYSTFGEIPKESILHVHFEDTKHLELARWIISKDNIEDSSFTELQFIIKRLAELKISRKLEPMILDVAEEIQQGHGYEALEIIQNGVSNVMKTVRNEREKRDSRADIEGDIKASIFLRADDVENKETKDVAVFKSGFRQFDEFFGGFKEGQLIVLASPTGDGKSITAMNLGGNMFMDGGHNVLYILLEMDRAEWELRFDSWLTGIDFRRLYLNQITPEEMIEYKLSQIRMLLDPSNKEENEEIITKLDRNYKNDLMNVPLKVIVENYLSECKFRTNIYYPIDVPRGCSMDILETKFNHVRQKYGCDVVIVDYPGIMEHGGNGDNNWLYLSDLFRQLKAFARFYRILLIVPAQLHDEEISGDRRFSARWLRFSKAIADHSDLVLGWVRSPQDLRDRRLTMHAAKTRQFSNSFEIVCDANFDKMKITENEFRAVGG